VLAGGRRSKRALTLACPPIETMQVAADEEHVPLKPENLDPLAGVAVRVTTLERAKVATQAPPVPQAIPGGDDVTDPSPSPVLATSSW
jgi:hypothetical protein